LAKPLRCRNRNLNEIYSFFVKPTTYLSVFAKLMNDTHDAPVFLDIIDRRRKSNPAIITRAEEGRIVSSIDGFITRILDVEQDQMVVEEVVDKPVVVDVESTHSYESVGDPAASDERTGSRSNPNVDEAAGRRRRKYQFVVIALIPLVAASALLGTFMSKEMGDTKVSESSAIERGTTSSPSSVIATEVGPSPAPKAMVGHLASTIEPSWIPPSSSSPSTPSLTPTSSSTACISSGPCHNYVICCSGICIKDENFDEMVCKEDAAKPDDDAKPDDSSISPSSSSPSTPSPTPTSSIMTMYPTATSTVSPTTCISSGSCDNNAICCSGICIKDHKFDEMICKEVAVKPGDAEKPENAAKPEHAPKE
jgi:hypothetical protein